MATAAATFHSRPVISLNEVLDATTENPQALDLLCEQLSQQGWAFVCDWIPAEPKTESIDGLVNALSMFFKEDPLEKKQRFSAKYGFGYSSVDHKEGIRVLTGPRFKQDFEKKRLIPIRALKNYDTVCPWLDTLAQRLTLKLAPALFGHKASTVAQLADLPVAYIHQPHFGMLDAAHYFNAKEAPSPQPDVGSSVDEVNCVPHYDPGLFAFSFYSDNEGLELQDPRTNEWIPGPINTQPEQKHIGVIWLGDAAVKATKEGNSVKPGVHRVVYPSNGKDRLTLWYEMCTVTQATPPKEVGDHPGGMLTIETLPSSQPMKVEKNATVVNVLKDIERKLGVPMSKIRQLGDRFKSFPERTE